MSDLISRADAIEVILKEQKDDIEAYGCAIPESFDGDRAVRVLKQLPTINIYDDMSEYSDRLWKLAYERGKKEGFNDALSIKVEPLTDDEQRIFLSAMSREEKICKEFDDNIFSCYAVSLVRVCHEITRKVKDVLWTGRRLEDGKE